MLKSKRFRWLLYITLTLASIAPALAHDSWISRGGFRGPTNGEWCCGDHDCVVIPTYLVKPNGVGYELLATKEVVPYNEALPSQDGQYWRCHRADGSRRCFFAPQTSSQLLERFSTNGYWFAFAAKNATKQDQEKASDSIVAIK